MKKKSPASLVPRPESKTQDSGLKTQDSAHEHCPVDGCTVAINSHLKAVCDSHARLVPPYWLKRWKKAVAGELAAKSKSVHDRQLALKESEFVRAAIIGACQRVQP